MKDTRLYGVARSNKQEIKRFTKFAVVGGGGLILDYAILNALTLLFGMDSAPAVAIAFVCAATNNFIWNRLWVYPESRVEKKRKQLPVFLAVNAAGLLINEVILLLLETPLVALLGSAFLGLNLTKGVAAVVVMVWNFIVNRLVTFRMVKLQISLEQQQRATAEGDIAEPVESAL